MFFSHARIVGINKYPHILKGWVRMHAHSHARRQWHPGSL